MCVCVLAGPGSTAWRASASRRASSSAPRCPYSLTHEKRRTTRARDAKRDAARRRLESEVGHGDVFQTLKFFSVVHTNVSTERVVRFAGPAPLQGDERQARRARGGATLPPRRALGALEFWTRTKRIESSPKQASPPSARASRASARRATPSTRSTRARRVQVARRHFCPERCLGGNQLEAPAAREERRSPFVVRCRRRGSPPRRSASPLRSMRPSTACCPSPWRRRTCPSPWSK